MVKGASSPVVTTQPSNMPVIGDNEEEEEEEEEEEKEEEEEEEEEEELPKSKTASIRIINLYSLGFFLTLTNLPNFHGKQMSKYGSNASLIFSNMAIPPFSAIFTLGSSFALRFNSFN